MVAQAPGDQQQRARGKIISAQPSIAVKNVTIYKSFNEADALLVRAQLEAAGFHVFMPDESMAAIYALAIGGIRLQVPDTEEEEAKAFLAVPAESE